MTPEQADQNVRHIRKPLDDYAQGPQETERWYAAIEEMERRARLLLMSCNPPEGHITLPDGRWVKFCGEPVWSGDGAVVSAGAQLFSPEGGGGPQPDGTVRMLVRGNSTYPEDHYYIAGWFTTREAAEAAAKEGR